MSKLVPWSRFIKRNQVDPARLLSRFDNYQEFSRWFIRMGGSPPPAEDVSQYFINEEIVSPGFLEPESIKCVIPKHQLRNTLPAVSMKNTKVQLLELAASHDIIVSYYDTKLKILEQMQQSRKFYVHLPKSK